jgi:hypothetical protein
MDKGRGVTPFLLSLIETIDYARHKYKSWQNNQKYYSDLRKEYKMEGEMQNKLIIREHAIRRLLSNRFAKSGILNRKGAIQLIEKDIKYSFLLKLNPDGTELRAHNGRVYVCKKQMSNIEVITVLKATEFSK